MTDENDPSERFEERLHQLLNEADENGLEVRGAWTVEDEGSETCDWCIEVTRVESNR
jgi:hypothetical protein